MQKTRAQLSVFHDGQFFTAVFERDCEDGYSAAKIVFAQKPSDNTILETISEQYYHLEFSQAAGKMACKELCQNPKRRQRQAAKTAKVMGTCTKAQEALKRQYKQKKTESKKNQRTDREKLKLEKYNMYCAKKKEKLKGH